MKRVRKLQLFFVGGSVGLSMFATYLFGFLLGLTLIVTIFSGIDFYIRKKQAKALKFFGIRDADLGSTGRAYTNGGSTKLSYVCLSCGTKVTGRTCRKCGSHMKKVVF
ncbi:MAG: hypothetical protein WBE34_08030 [Candidatus Nitrosopolaris sp.]